MKVSLEIMNQSIDEFTAQGPGCMEKVIDDLFAKQPALMPLFEANDQTIASEEAKEVQYQDVCVIWQSMKKVYPQISKITTKTILEQMERNQLLHQGSEDYILKLYQKLDTYPEPDLLQFILYTITEQYNEYFKAEHEVELAILFIKTVADCLLQGV